MISKTVLYMLEKGAEIKENYALLRAWTYSHLIYTQTLTEVCRAYNRFLYIYAIVQNN